MGKRVKTRVADPGVLDPDPDWPGCFSGSDSDPVFSRRLDPVDNDLIF